MPDSKEKITAFILFVFLCFTSYLMFNVINDGNELLQKTEKMAAVCKKNGYTTYTYPSSGGLDSSRFRCQKIEYTYSKEYFKL